MDKLIANNEKEFTINFGLLIPKNIDLDNVIFACIGTDRSTGDSLGPLIGDKLEKLGYTNVIGTLDEPLHAMNLADRLKDISDDKVVIGIDACLGQVSHIGRLRCGLGPIKPGAGVNKVLPDVGKYHITGTVNVGGFMEYFVLQNTRLGLVVNMANSIVKGITKRFPLDEIKAILEVAAAEQARRKDLK